MAGTAAVRRGHATEALYKERLGSNAQLQSSPGTHPAADLSLRLHFPVSILQPPAGNSCKPTNEVYMLILGFVQ